MNPYWAVRANPYRSVRVVSGPGIDVCPTCGHPVEGAAAEPLVRGLKGVLMGWGSGTNAAGREIGYLVEATCDQDGCETEIDRGLAYVCGGMHDGGEDGCGRYFCESHLFSGVKFDGQLCDRCSAEAERAYDVKRRVRGSR